MHSSERLRGFTLIELLVVISIIALLSSVVLASLNAARDKARTAAGLRFSTSLDRSIGADAAMIVDFDEGSGTSSVNKAGGNNLVVNGATWSADTPFAVGSSLSYPGTLYSYVNPANQELADVTDEGKAYTFAVWYKATAAPPINDGYVLLRNGFHTGIYHRKSDNRIGGVQWFTTPQAINIMGPVIEYGRWYHIAFVSDSTASSLKLYVDGVEVASASYGSLTNYEYGNTAFQVGGSPTYYASGLVDSPRVFPRALVASEVHQLYASEREAVARR